MTSEDSLFTQTDITGVEEYFASLFARLGEAKAAAFREVKMPGWEPKLSDCHRNVDFFVERNLGHLAVHGWLTWGPDATGRCLFIAHTLVEQDGELVDITPLDSSTSRDGLMFLRHLGTDAEFGALSIPYSSVWYPLVTFAEMQSVRVAGNSEDEE